MTEYKNTNIWFNVKDENLTVKMNDKVYSVPTIHVGKTAIVLVHDHNDTLWLNETASGKAYRTYINDVIHVVSKVALQKVIDGEIKGTTFSVLE